MATRNEICKINMAASGWSGELEQALNAESSVILVEGFLPKDFGCRTVRDLLEFSKTLVHGDEKQGVRYSVDIHPEGVMTDRIFRSWNFDAIGDIPIESCHTLFGLLRTFQSRFITSAGALRADAAVRPQIIHYPIGGGFFDWHRHPRCPVNYGLIANLSRMGREFSSGNTEIRTDDGRVIKVEDHLGEATLVLFKYDLEHRVAPCDPFRELTFDTNGKWSAILPIY